MSDRAFRCMSGADLAAIRKFAGLSQSRLAERAGIGRHAVSYWETKPVVDLKGWAPGRMFKVLGIEVLPYFRHRPRARERT
ncbi:helix-turn-helix transcriptional regulator [Tropicimonas sp. IMCC6043]|uniref:helix-turn-helix transcriptional regulator n=1 Tax=Tropicimonas sp. IMCC6043 TaxID=2510645 RepID=UPI00101D9336|nr:helix-turn-helix transcriptional regulator [Tropicimonas sp. IMCC6043]RYH10514.1 XRE family transcriptional regulator [Tropicimonas sp. IMCC6043]